MEFEKWKCEQNAGIYLPCPRCGRNTMKTPASTNALSRRADIYICDSCGMEEALESIPGATKKPMSDWFAFSIENK